MDSINSSKPVKTIKRRNFIFLLGASAAGALLLAKSPLKFITSKFSATKPAAKAGTSKSSITVKENPYAVKRNGRSA